MKILDSVWFTEMMSDFPIGIILIETDFGEIKAYIGTGYGNDEKEDSEKIAKYGARFDLESAKVYFPMLETILKEREKGKEK